jgi:hypothetical protein
MGSRPFGTDAGDNPMPTPARDSQRSSLAVVQVAGFKTNLRQSPVRRSHHRVSAEVVQRKRHRRRAPRRYRSKTTISARTNRTIRGAALFFVPSGDQVSVRTGWTRSLALISSRLSIFVPMIPRLDSLCVASPCGLVEALSARLASEMLRTARLTRTQLREVLREVNIVFFDLPTTDVDQNSANRLARRS